MNSCQSIILAGGAQITEIIWDEEFRDKHFIVGYKSMVTRRIDFDYFAEVVITQSVIMDIALTKTYPIVPF